MSSVSSGSGSCLSSLHPSQEFQSGLSGSGHEVTLCSCCKRAWACWWQPVACGWADEMYQQCEPKSGSVVGAQLGPSSPRGTGYPCSIHTYCDDHRQECCAGCKTVGPRGFQLGDFAETGARALKLCSDF